jgi:prepilin-type N-terminal cleavage/methylation domain-containing protein
MKNSSDIRSVQARGFTLLELIVVVCILAILGGTLLNRIWFYQEQAERAAMEQVASALQSALTLEFGRLMIRGKDSGASALAMENPMNWLARKPSNYEGEFYKPTPQSVPPGSWMFDLKSRDLIYIVERGEYFTPGKDGVKWVRYHVKLIYEDTPVGDSKANRPVSGAIIEPVETYLWFDRRLR